MRNGFKVFDADTHFHPTVESLEPFFGPDLQARAAELEALKTPQRTGWAGERMSEPYRHLYRFGHGGGWGASPPRHLGEAGPRPDEQRRFQKFMGFKTPTEGGADHNLAGRVRDMDEEGVDVHLQVPGAASGHQDPAVDLGMLQAFHRYLDHACGQFPDRLRSLLLLDARFVEESVAEIKQWGKATWPVGIMVNLPLNYPVDHPDLDPIWAAADDAGLGVVHHSFATGYPGYRDLWDNPFIGRTASHPWAAMRMVAAFLGAGLMDRFPNIRLSILESGFGWLPFWMKRMEDQMVYMGYVAEGLKHSMTEYMTGGRFFAGIVLHETEDMVHMVNELMGDHILMFGSDYPHAESRFPKSVDMVTEWEKLTDEQKRKLLWENAARCYLNA